MLTIPSLSDYEILYGDISSKDEQLEIRPSLWKGKRANEEEGWNLKFVYSFIEITHEPFFSRRMKLPNVVVELLTLLLRI
jgi:hypothetical protein